MASVIEQFRDLFVFAYGKKCDLGLAVAEKWGRENNTPETQSMTINVLIGITNDENVLFAKLYKQLNANWSIAQIVECNYLCRDCSVIAGTNKVRTRQSLDKFTFGRDCFANARNDKVRRICL